jgi:8-oxo-dGTP pyrophosphatase MutT (NUDIX family)
MQTVALQYSRWLEAYRPRDDLEAAHLAVHRVCWAERRIGADVPDRHLTASCFIAHPDGDRVLVHWHAKLRRFLQPGGHLDSGETPVEACLREVLEEAGLRILREPEEIFDLDVHRVLDPPSPRTATKGRVATDNKSPASLVGPHDHGDARFYFRMPGGGIPLSPEGSEFRWMTWEDLAASDPADTGLARVAAKARDLQAR